MATEGDRGVLDKTADSQKLLPHLLFTERFGPHVGDLEGGIDPFQNHVLRGENIVQPRQGNALRTIYVSKLQTPTFLDDCDGRIVVLKDEGW